MNMIKDLTDQIKSYYDTMIIILPKLAIAIILVGIILFILSFLRKKLVKIMIQKADDPLLVNFLDGAIRFFNLIIGGLIFLTMIGQQGIAGSILGAASVSAIVIGFAFKDIAENFLAGVIMAFKRPFRVGDTIQTGDVEGNIISMSLRDSRIKTFDGKDVFVPNAQILKNPLYNYTIDGFLRKSFTIGLDYGENVEECRRIIEKSLKNIPGILQKEKIAKTLISELGSSTINIKALYWIDTFDQKHSASEIQSKAIDAALTALNNAGVTMPGDVVELKNYKEAPIKSLQQVG